MKFLIFNLVVAGALIYLFFAGQPETQTIAEGPERQLQEQVHDAKAQVPELPGPPDDSLQAEAQPKPTNDAASAANLETQLAGLKELLRDTTPADEPLPPPPPVPAQRAPELKPAPDARDTARAQADGLEQGYSRKSAETITPEVAERRALVLEESSPAAPPAKPAAARRQALRQLSEEMELMAVEALAQ